MSTARKLAVTAAVVWGATNAQGDAPPPPAAKPFGFRRVAVGASKATFSPDGARVAVGRIPLGKGIDVVDLASGARTPLVETGKDPAWSPDGRLIAFVEDPRPDVDGETVWVVEARGGTPRRLARGFWPSFSADGKRIYFSTPPEGHVHSIALDEPRAKPRLLYSGEATSTPALSPTGDRLAYGVGSDLHVVNPLTGDVVLHLRVPGGRNLMAAWSPDGQAVAYGSDGAESPGVALYFFDSQRSHGIVKGPFTLPAWSRDSRLLAFDFRMGDARDVWVTDTIQLHRSGLGQMLSEAKGGWKERAVVLPELARADLDRRVWRLDDREGRLLFVNIWATWCAPCRDELPLVQALYERARTSTDFGVLTLNVDDSPEKARRFASAMGLTVPIIPARDYVQRQVGGGAIPRNWIVGAGRKMLAERLGFNVKDRNNWVAEVLAQLERLRKSQAPPP